jgi:hypothetical protein
MTAFFAALYAFVLAHQAAIVAAVLVVTPSIITGLTPYPKASGVVSGLRLFLNVFSVLTHSDSPGTLKAPLTVSSPPVGLAIGYGSSRGFIRWPALALAVLCIAGFGLGLGCAGVFGPTIASDLKACGAKVTQDVESQVAATLLAGGVTWEADLITLGAQIGNDGLICAIQVAIADFQAQHAAEPTAAPQSNALVASTPDAHTAAIARAKAFLASHSGG